MASYGTLSGILGTPTASHIHSVLGETGQARSLRRWQNVCQVCVLGTRWFHGIQPEGSGAVARRLRKINRYPENGSTPSFSRQSCANPSMHCADRPTRRPPESTVEGARRARSPPRLLSEVQLECELEIACA